MKLLVFDTAYTYELLKKRGIERKAKGGMVSKKKSKVAGKLALRGYGRAMKGKK